MDEPFQPYDAKGQEALMTYTHSQGRTGKPPGPDSSNRLGEGSQEALMTYDEGGTNPQGLRIKPTRCGTDGQILDGELRVPADHAQRVSQQLGAHHLDDVQRGAKRSPAASGALAAAAAEGGSVSLSVLPSGIFLGPAGDGSSNYGA